MSLEEKYSEGMAKTRAVFVDYKERFGTRNNLMLFLESTWKPRIIAHKIKKGLSEEEARCEYAAVIRQFVDPILPSEHEGYVNAWAKFEQTYEAALEREVLKEADAEFATFNEEYRMERQVKPKFA
jgi:hypothetical protein